MTGLHHTSARRQPVDFTAASVKCTKIAVGTMDNNCYLLDAGGPVVLIDAADEADRLLAVLGARRLSAVVTTHQHADHVRALAQVVAATRAEAFAGEPDAGAITRQTGVTCQPLWTGDQLTLGGIHLEVIGLVGHTPGSIALVLRDETGTHIFTGDSLFPGGVGNTAGLEQFSSLLGDVQRELFDRFDDDTIIHPVHGDATTLGAERPHLPAWAARGW